MMGMFVDGAADSHHHHHHHHFDSPKSSFDSDLASPMTMAVEENRQLKYSHSHQNSGTQHNPYQGHFQHRGSTSTTHSTSESTDSSPTTTISTVDSASITDPSPNSSPDSHVTIVPLSAFTSKTNGIIGAHHDSDELMMSPPLSPLPGYNQPMSPGKRDRNMKNLSLNMSIPSRPAPRPPLQVTTASTSMLDTSLPQSAPPSPSFAFPMKPPMKKRPSKLGLSIQTPSTGSLPEATTNRGLRIVPPTPTLNLPNTLRHHQSSPSLSLFSPTAGIQGGMQLPAFNSSQSSHRPRQIVNLSRNSSIDSNSTTSGHASPDSSTRLSELEEEEDDYDPPLSQEVKSPAYPGGPVCIYDPQVYLYLEPTHDEAMQFDVIFNVAREVKNPFAAKAGEEVRSPCPDRQQAPSRPEAVPVASDVSDQTVVSEVVSPEIPSSQSMPNIQAVFETVSESDTASPTTPKASVSPSRATEPEYVHMQWDHNTSIVDDLFTLVETIDERVRQGKRVLIHCQCGVSRSASLIVAYGLYKNPSLTVQEAYDAVKKRSRWIGPNMSLIYQLSEFRTKLVKKVGIPQPGPRNWRNGGSKMGLGSGRANTIPTSSPTKRPSLSGETFDAPPSRRSEPLTAPLPDERDCGISQGGGSHASDGHLNPNLPTHMTGLGQMGQITPGPSSAPSGMSWLSDETLRAGRGPSGGSPWAPTASPIQHAQGNWGFPSIQPPSQSAPPPSQLSPILSPKTITTPPPTTSPVHTARRSRFAPSREVTISKALSFILRHGAVREGVALDSSGYARVSDLLEWKKLKNLKVTLEEVKAVVRDNNKQRFSLLFSPMSASPAESQKDSDDPRDYLMRASQGHSLAIEPAAHLTPITASTLPPAAIHGTYLSTWPLIVAAGGLCKMGRTHIHFSTVHPDEAPSGGAVGGVGGVGGGGVSGIRGGAEVLIWADVARSMADGGVKWWVSDNGVVLTDGRATRSNAGAEAEAETETDGLLSLQWLSRAVVRKTGKVLVEDGVVVADLTEEEARGGRAGRKDSARGKSRARGAFASRGRGFRPRDPVPTPADVNPAS